MDEIVAERKVEANAGAYHRAKLIESRLPENSYGALEKIVDMDGWFFSHRLFLPGQFPSKWMAIREGLFELNRWKGNPSKTAADPAALERRIATMITQAIDEIYKEMGMGRIVLGDLAEYPYES
jgi:hypothetical protein